jgi:DNA-binding beta-propeller fold protein YncE
MTIMAKKTALLALCLAVLGGLSVLRPWPAAATDRSPWQFAFSLLGQGKSMSLPVALYVDEERQRYYVVDSGANRLVSFAREGDFLQEFSAEGSLLKPHDMARLADGSLLVVERGRNSLTRIDLQQRRSEPQILRHQGREVFVDRLEVAEGRIYVLDRASGRILELDQELRVSRDLALPTGVGNLVDFKVADGRIWLLDQKNKQILSLAADGKAGRPLPVGEASFPVSLAVDQAGMFYVLDRHQGAVLVFDRNGAFRYRFLSKGHGRQHLYFPRELRFDPWGRLCVVDQGNSRVMVFRR